MDKLDLVMPSSRYASCCAAFYGWITEAGQRGVGIFPDNGDWILQFRAIDFADPLVVKSQTPITLATDLVISFCPWCGVNLKEYYGHVDAYDKPSKYRITLE